MKTKVADRRFIWLATAILLLAAALRLSALQEVPPGLSQDEVLNADIVKFILGGEQAIFFRHGYGHEALYHYLAVPFQVLLGDNVLSIRLPATILGLVLVALTMRWAKRDYGSLAALIAGAGLAIGWWAIIFSRVGIRPMLEPVLLVAAAWAWPRRSWLAGILLGLAIYSYTAARYIFLLPLGMLLYLIVFHRRGQTLSRSQPDSFASIRSALIVFLISLAFYVPLALTLRADPTLQQRVEQLSGPLDALREGDLQPVVETTIATLGVFSFRGDPRWTYSIPGRPIFGPLASIFFMLGLGLVIWRWKRPRYAMLLIWFGLAMLPSALSPDAPSTIRLIGLLPVVYLLPGISGQWLWRRSQAMTARTNNGAEVLRVVPWLVLALLLGVGLWRTIDDGFVRWPEALETRLKYQSVLKEMADHWQQEGRPALVVVDSFFEPIDADSLRRNLGYDPGARWVQSGQGATGALVIPNQEGFSRLYVPEYAPVAEDLLRAAGIDPAPIYRSEARPSFAVYENSNESVSPTFPESAQFDEAITFLGHDLLQADEEQIRLLSYWEVKRSLSPDLAAFVHLVNEEGEIVAQHDGLDAAPQLIKPGDIVIQYHVLPTKDVVANESLSLLIGLYERDSQRRLFQSGTGLDRLMIASQVILTKE